MIQCLEVWKLYLNFVTQQDTQRKITLLKSIVIHENTLSASSKIAVWQFLSCKAAPMQDTAINPVSDEWTSKWKHPCLHGTVKHRQATAEADHQDAPLHQPWRNIYSEDKKLKVTVTDLPSKKLFYVFSCLPKKSLYCWQGVNINIALCWKVNCIVLNIQVKLIPLGILVLSLKKLL